MNNKIIYIVIPTYNEAENIEALLREIGGLNIPGLVSLVVDDNSPDGTGRIVDRLAKESPSVKVLHRFEERGRGSAGIAGFRQALKEGADYIIEMDADFSHQPAYIPALLARARECDVVLGSRFVPGGKDADRNFICQIVTTFARTYIGLMLGIKVRDITSGYRCFKREVLEKIDLGHMLSTGPSIVTEILYKATLAGFKLCEVPIVFIDRKKGKTKLSFTTLLKTLYMVYKFRRIYK